MLFSPRFEGLDGLLLSRLLEENYSPLRRRYFESPSLPFFLVASVYHTLRDSAHSPQALSDVTKIRIVCVSDTHNYLFLDSFVPDGDIFIHAGDLTQSGSVSELTRTLDWMRALPHAHKIFIAGNHDWALADSVQRKALDLTGLTYLCDETVTLSIRDRTLHIFGSPWTPQHGNFAFQFPRDRAVKHWEHTPHPIDIDILLTHGPPKAHVDHNGHGCAALLDVLWRIRPSLVVCGHIHAGRGAETLKWDEAQKRWEGAVKAGKIGWCDAIILVCMLAWAWIRPTDSRQTKIVNCAVTGGVRDQLIRNPVILNV